MIREKKTLPIKGKRKGYSDSKKKKAKINFKKLNPYKSVPSCIFETYPSQTASHSFLFQSV